MPVLETLDVEFAVALVDLAVAVFRVLRLRHQALLGLFFTLQGVQLRCVRHAEVSVFVDTENLQALDGRRAHEKAMRDAFCVRQVGRGVVHDQIVGIHGLGHRTIANRAVIDLFERRTTKPEHQKHAIGVGVILGRDRSQVVIEVFLQRIGLLVDLNTA